MLCPQCGVEVGDEVRLCASCEDKAERGETLSNEEYLEEAFADPLSEESPQEDAEEPIVKPAPSRFAGFFGRLLAILIDYFVIVSALTIINSAVFHGFGLLSYTGAFKTPGVALVLLPIFLLTFVVNSIPALLYFVGFESSKYRATPGKIACGYAVTDFEGNRLTRKAALIRFLAKHLCVIAPLILILIGILLGALIAAFLAVPFMVFAFISSFAIFLIGYGMAAFTEKHQALHDLIARTYVINRGESSAVKKAVSLIASVFSCLVISWIFGPSDRAEVAPEPAAPVPAVSVTATPPTILSSTTIPAPATPSQLLEATANLGELRLEYFDSAAFIDAEKRIIELGLFKNRLSKDDLKTLQRVGSFMGEDSPKPALSVTLYLKSGAGYCSLEALARYAVTYLSDGTGSASGGFPYEAKSTANNARISKFSCTFSEGSELQFSTADSVAAPNGKAYTWDIHAKTKMIAAKDLAGPSLPSPTFPENTIASGETSSTIKSSLMLYHAKHNRLEIGLYAEELSPDEIKAVRARGTLRALGPGKSPMLLIGASLKEGTAENEKKEIEDFFYTFTRQPLGTFYFPGSRDSVTIERGWAPDPRNLAVSGSFADNGRAILKGAGRENVKKEGVELNWRFEQTCSVIRVVND